MHNLVAQASQVGDRDLGGLVREEREVGRGWGTSFWKVASMLEANNFLPDPKENTGAQRTTR